MADPLYRFNPAAERYIAPSGQFVSRAAVRATLDSVLEAQMSRISARSADLVAGNVDLATWRAEVAQAAKIAHLEGAAVARGGWQQLSQDDYEWVGERVRGQLGYLQRFHDDLASGVVPMDGTVASRAEMYVEQGRATQRAMESRMAQARGVDEEKNVLGGSRDPCSECPGLSAMGWVPVGSLPEVGARACLSRCHCHMLYRTNKTPDGLPDGLPQALPDTSPATGPVGVVPLPSPPVSVPRTTTQTAPSLPLADRLATVDPTLHVYHATPGEPFTRFDPERFGSATDDGLLGRGAYFSTDPNIGKYGDQQRTTLETNVSLRNPLVVNFPAWGADKNRLVNEAIGTSGLSGEPLTRVLTERGHDGVVLDYAPVGYLQREVAVFHLDSVGELSVAKRPI